jgi:hypothetical protein
VKVVRGLVVRGGAVARPAAKAIGRSALAANRGGAITILAGEPASTARLVEITGASPGTGLGKGLLVFAAVPHADHAAAAQGLGDHRRSGGRALAIVIGSPTQRRRIENALIAADRDISAATIAHLDDLDDPGKVRAAVVRGLGDQRIGAAKAVPAVRESVSKSLVASSARRAALVAAVPGLNRVAMPILTSLQLGLAADLSNANARPLNGQIAGQSAGVMASAFAWREAARRLSRRAPSAAPAIRAGVAYAATRSVGLVSGRLGATHSPSSKGES